MDNETLLELFGDTGKRQFWIKPWGDRDRPADERETFDDAEIRLCSLSRQSASTSAMYFLCIGLKLRNSHAS
jgi:hypothetical protein